MAQRMDEKRQKMEKVGWTKDPGKDWKRKQCRTGGSSTEQGEVRRLNAAKKGQDEHHPSLVTTGKQQQPELYSVSCRSVGRIQEDPGSIGKQVYTHHKSLPVEAESLLLLVK